MPAWGLTPESAQRLRALLAALRSTPGFREAVLRRCGGCALEAAALAAEDPQSWADEDLKAKRAEWRRAGLARG
ncbi:unnamed protein product [Effrenium voratum]|uniref:Uncharacterized protein n=1 Tax=Effrenium voratum TaxID=2562239 RepID=A0AA36J1C6_9DINO|nr:unnamed protein product [Effrenium voratum]